MPNIQFVSPLSTCPSYVSHLHVVLIKVKMDNLSDIIPCSYYQLLPVAFRFQIYMKEQMLLIHFMCHSLILFKEMGQHLEIHTIRELNVR